MAIWFVPLEHLYLTILGKQFQWTFVANLMFFELLLQPKCKFKNVSDNHSDDTHENHDRPNKSNGKVCESVVFVPGDKLRDEPRNRNSDCKI